MPTTIARHASGAPTHGVGPMLREWRERRRLSQLELSTVAAVSTRHLSYVETGRSRPSRELILHLARELDVPLREQNGMTGDDRLVELLAEVSEYLPAGTAERSAEPGETPVAIPMRLRVDDVERSYLSVVSTFGTAVDVNASELTIETFYEV